MDVLECREEVDGVDELVVADRDDDTARDRVTLTQLEVVKGSARKVWEN